MRPSTVPCLPSIGAHRALLRAVGTEVPSKRWSAAAFSMSTATRSSTALRTMERGTRQLGACPFSGLPTRLRHTRGARSPPG